MLWHPCIVRCWLVDRMQTWLRELLRFCTPLSFFTMVSLWLYTDNTIWVYFEPPKAAWSQKPYWAPVLISAFNAESPCYNGQHSFSTNVTWSFRCTYCQHLNSGVLSQNLLEPSVHRDGIAKVLISQRNAKHDIPWYVECCALVLFC